jgi:hypothetical protein
MQVAYLRGGQTVQMVLHKHGWITTTSKPYLVYRNPRDQVDDNVLVRIWQRGALHFSNGLQK